MAEQLDDRQLTILYHALGADVDSGIRRYELAFRAAEADYRHVDLDLLLTLLADPTLEDPRLLAWQQYFALRSTLLRWNLAAADQLVTNPIAPRQEDKPRLTLRFQILRSQMQVMRGEWVAGHEALQATAHALQQYQEPLLAADADEWIARALIGRAQSAGDWEKPNRDLIAILWQWLQGALISPFYLILFAFLYATSASHFAKAVWFYGANFSNWPIFTYYFSAYRALNRALNNTPTTDPHRRFRLSTMQADLLRRVHADQAALALYENLAADLIGDDYDYRWALVKHGEGQVHLALGQVKKAQQCLEQAILVYQNIKDRHYLAHANMLLGDIALGENRCDEAIDLWAAALAVFQEKEDRLGTDEILNRFYSILTNQVDQPATEQTKARVRLCINALTFQAFVVRMPSRLFALIQQAGWLVPLLIMLLYAMYAALRIQSASREGMATMSQTVLSLRWVGQIIAVLVLILVSKTLLGMVGLLTTIWLDSTRLDIIRLDKTGISLRDFVDHEIVSLAWASIDHYLHVERILWHRPARSLSFDFLYTDQGNWVRLPGTTARFDLLRQEIGRYVKVAPNSFRLRWWYLMLAIVITPVAMAITFKFDQSAFPSLSVQTHAWLASGMAALGYVFLSFITVQAIWHYMNVGLEVLKAKTKQSQLRNYHYAIVLISLCMLAFGTVLRELVHIFSPLFLLGGLVLLFALLRCNIERSSAVQCKIPLFYMTAVLVATLLMAWSVLPPILVHQAYTFSGAASSYHADCAQSTVQGDRTRCFAQIATVSQWILRIDPTYHLAHGYKGYTEFSAGEYQQGVDSFTQTLDYALFDKAPDYFYCRALAYEQWSLAPNIDATQKAWLQTEKKKDCAEFVKRRRLDQVTVCERLFREVGNSCLQQ